MASKSLSQNLSCDSSRSNFSTFESLDLNLSDCSDLASSLPSCASGNVNDAENKEDGKLAKRLILSTLLIGSKLFSFIPTRYVDVNDSERLCFAVWKITVFILAK